MSARRVLVERRLLAGLGAVLAAFLLLPLVSLVFATSPGTFGEALTHPLFSAALGLSLVTTLLSLLLVVLFGTPLAWTLARAQGRGARLVETMIELPIVVPPAVAGVALLFAFGRRGLLAGILYPEGSSLAFTVVAVVMAQIFVSAPFYVQAAASAFRRLDEGLLVVARTFGASPVRIFLRIALPISGPALVGGAAMSFARALGEFGATLMFAGNLRGVTQTLPLAVYTALESDLALAQAMSVVLVAVALALLVVARLAYGRAAERRDFR